jgi:hypothetical protein
MTKIISTDTLKAWREDWLAAYGNSDSDTDQVTPFDAYLYSKDRIVTLEAACEALNDLSIYFHKRSKVAGWWLDPVRDEQGEILRDEFGKPAYVIDKSEVKDPIFDGIKIALIMSEGAEALEAHRTDCQDDKLPQFKGVDTELADILIRVFDTAGKRKVRIGEVVLAKDGYNGIRPDHKPEARFDKPNGKKF